MAFCCCWPYEAPLPDEGIRTPIATSACAGTTAAISIEATAAPIIFLVVAMARVLCVGDGEIRDVKATVQTSFWSIADPTIMPVAGSHPAPAGP